MRIIPGHSPDRIELVRTLFEEYARSLDFELCFQNFQAELDGLPGVYAPPRGRLLLAVEGEDAAGCIAMRPLEADICEMKRLYARPSHRGRGVGRMLVDALLREAAEAGFTRMRLDTVPSMRSAVGLYESVGFHRIPAYCHNPICGAMYFELDLHARRNARDRI